MQNIINAYHVDVHLHISCEKQDERRLNGGKVREAEEEGMMKKQSIEFNIIVILVLLM